MKLARIFSFVAILFSILASIPAHATPYMSADFSGGVTWPNFINPGTFDGMDMNNNTSVSGHFVYDTALIPGAQSGLMNISPDMPGSGFPDVALIPSAALFTINLGSKPVTFTFSDSTYEGFYHDAAIQYYNGNFHGFFFDADFNYNNQKYQFSDQGTIWSIYEYLNGDPSVFVAGGYINSALTDVQSYVLPDPAGDPPSATPEPGTMLLMGIGALGMAALRRRSRKASA